MKILDYFRPVDTWTADEVRRFLNERDQSEYNLVDVRTAKEYEKEHIPGARLIPMAELDARLSELDPQKPTITY